MCAINRYFCSKSAGSLGYFWPRNVPGYSWLVDSSRVGRDGVEIRERLVSPSDNVVDRESAPRTVCMSPRRRSLAEKVPATKPKVWAIFSLIPTYDSRILFRKGSADGILDDRILDDVLGPLLRVSPHFAQVNLLLVLGFQCALQFLRSVLVTLLAEIIWSDRRLHSLIPYCL